MHRHQGCRQLSAGVDAERTEGRSSRKIRAAAFKTEGCLGWALIKISST